ncbi:MAG TPA: FAD-dependent oxidoreductase [Pseudomonas sp.]|uniref:NAD(P)/FAD-dependent oxidoreductase n=1 Tax=Pseudomonas sp. TaxID=306 RepID=UPI002ED8BD73
MTTPRVCVVGGGLVGMALAYGLACAGESVCLLDQGDVAWRAARGNFGLVWVQGKGVGLPAYARWTRTSAALWPRLAQNLLAQTGIDVQLRQPGGFQLCLDAAELDEEVRRLNWLRDALGSDYRFEVLDLPQLQRRLPGAGPTLAGACYCPDDGHVNPLLLLRALSTAMQQRGVSLYTNANVQRIERVGEGYRLSGEGREWTAERVVLAAGLGNRELAAQVGLNIEVQPNRGQILVTERIAPFLHYPTSYVRQTAEGSVQLGDSHEAVGLDDGVSRGVMSDLAQRAVRCFPQLASAQVVRTWGALRVLSPDGYPIYQESREAPGVFAATCHSGVTLAAAHAFVLSPWLAGGAAPDDIAAFNDQRFKESSHEG